MGNAHSYILKPRTYRVPWFGSVKHARYNLPRIYLIQTMTIIPGLRK